MPRPSDIYLSIIYFSIIIPAFNEAARIERSLDEITDFLDKQSYKSGVLVVADGSTDQALPRVSRAALWRQYINALDNRVNRGKGAAVHHGMLSANGEVLLYSDADLPTPIGEVRRLIEVLEGGADIALASRRMAESEIRVRTSWLSNLTSGLFGRFVRAAALPGIGDAICGFKLFRRAAAFDIFPRQRIEGYCFDVELLRIARRLGYRITEVPRSWGNHPVSKFRSVTDSLQTLVDVGRIRFYDMRRAYVPTPAPPTDATPE